MDKQTRNNDFTIGHATFNSKLTKKMKENMIKTRKTKILEQKSWIIQRNMFVRQKWPLLLQYMEKSSCERIDLYANYFPQIMRNLCFPLFDRILTLELNRNQITNVQALNFLDMKSINCINLDDNLISSIQTMNKLNWPHLSQPSLRGNHIKQIDMSRMRTSIYYGRISLEYYYYRYKATQGHNLSFFIKLQNQDIRYIEIYSPNRIKQNKALRSIQRKHSKISVTIRQ